MESPRRAQARTLLVGSKLTAPSTLSLLIFDLKTCSISRDLERARKLHSLAVEKSLFSNVYVFSILINIYSRCGTMAEAQQVFDTVPHHQRNVVSWNSLILGYAENGQSELALELFDKMRSEAEGCIPDARTYVAALTACSALAQAGNDGRSSEWLEKGRMIHSRAALTPSCWNSFVENSLINMYSVCGRMHEARLVFDGMKRRELISWNALLQGYVESGMSELALELFDDLERQTGLAPDSRTFVAAISACASLAGKKQASLKLRSLQSKKWLEKGRSLHSRALTTGCCTIYVRNTLVTLYSTCGCMELARQVFQEIRERTVVSWNCLVQGYVEAGENEVALQLIAFMDLDGVRLNSATFAAALNACVNLLAIETGRVFHEEIICSGMERDVLVATCLVDFYGKCGDMASAERVFHSIPVKDICTWNTLVGGYSLQGDTERVFQLLETMKKLSKNPNEITLIHALSACSHAGETRRGRELFHSMEKLYGVPPNMMHYACMVDLLGRANLLEDALKMVKGMPFEADAAIWCSLLAACKTWNNEEVGRLAYESLMKLDGEDSAAYVMMSGIYYSGAGLNQDSRGSFSAEMMSGIHYTVARLKQDSRDLVPAENGKVSGVNLVD